MGMYIGIPSSEFFMNIYIKQVFRTQNGSLILLKFIIQLNGGPTCTDLINGKICYRLFNRRLFKNFYKDVFLLIYLTIHYSLLTQIPHP